MVTFFIYLFFCPSCNLSAKTNISSTWCYIAVKLTAILSIGPPQTAQPCHLLQ